VFGTKARPEEVATNVDFGCRLSSGNSAAAGDDDQIAALVESLDERVADAAGAASNENRVTGKVHKWGSCCSRSE
jgi:hypothetical protein